MPGHFENGITKILNEMTNLILLRFLLTFEFENIEKYTEN